MKYLLIVLLSLSLVAFAQDDNQPQNDSQATNTEETQTEATQTEETTTETAATEESVPNFLKVISDDDRLSTLTLLLSASGLLPSLEGGEFTIFAPTNYAFNVATEDLADVLEDPQTITNLLTAHVVEGAVSSSDLSDGQSLTTLAGSALAVSIVDGVTKVSGGAVLEADIQGSAIIIHVVDTVLSLDDTQQ